MDEDGINEIFETMASGLRGTQSRESAPEPQRKGIGAPAVPDVPEEPPNYAELFDPNSEKYNPAAAVQDIVGRQYGGLVNSVTSRNLDLLVESVAREYPKFKDYQDRIMQDLGRVPSSMIDRNLIRNTFFAYRGQDAEKAERQAAQAAATDVVDGPTHDEPGPKDRRGEMSDEERRVARVLFRDEDDPEAAWLQWADRVESSDPDKRYLKVPLGGGKNG